MGVRDITPHCLLRLGRDQASYDFVKWYATTGQESDYDWGNMDLPYLDTRDADAFEPVDIYDVRFPELSHLVAVALIKVRLLIDLEMLQNVHLTSNIARTSNITLRERAIAENTDLATRIDRLRTQVSRLYQAVHAANSHFWPALLDPGDNLTARPHSYSPGDLEEVQLKLKYTYDAWHETPGAVEFIRAALTVEGLLELC